MLVRQTLSRKNDGRCFPCFSLGGEPARVEPHAALSQVERVPSNSGTREEFVCASCGQRMVRFLATQTSPPPSNRWRYEQPAVSSFSGSAAPLGDHTDEAQEAPACDETQEALDSDEALDPPALGKPDEPMQEPSVFSLLHPMDQ